MVVNNGKGCVDYMVLLPLYLFFILCFFQTNTEIQFLLKTKKTYKKLVTFVFIQTVAIKVILKSYSSYAKYSVIIL